MKWRSFIPLVPLIIGLASLELLVRSGWIPSFLIPPPSQVARTLFTDRAELSSGFAQTALASVAGLTLSFVSGLTIALFLASSRLARSAFQPYAIFFQTVPIVAIAPLLVIWFGFGLPTVIASAFIVSLFPIIASTLLGFESTDPALVDLFRLHDATAFDTLFRLRMPFALPYIFSGLRISSGLAVIGAIVGEFIAGGGLGSIVDVARTRQRIDLVFAAVLISSMLGLMMVSVIDFATWLCLRNWHASARKPQ